MTMERASTWAARLEPGAYSALRIIAGLMFSLHGMQKLFGWFGSQMHPQVLTLWWFAGVIELLCGLLIALGLFTRPAAFLAAGEMAVAYFGIHWKLSFEEGRWAPLINQGELAALYALLFLFVFTYGPGLFSLDALFRRPSAREPRGRPVPVGPLAGEHGGGG
jgi:putative oxidoreductase